MRDARGEQMESLFSHNLDYIQFIHAFFLFFITAFALHLFRSQKKLQWLWLGLFSTFMALSLAFLLISQAQPEQGSLFIISGSLKALSFIFLALFGAQGLPTGKIRNSGYVLAALLLILPIAGAVQFGATGFSAAIDQHLGLVCGLVGLCGLWWLRKEIGESGLLFSFYPLLAAYFLCAGPLPALHSMFAVTAEDSTDASGKWMGILEILHAATTATVAIVMARSTAFGREKPDSVKKDKPFAFALGVTAVGFAIFMGFALTSVLGSGSETSIRNELFMRVSAVGNALDPEEVGALVADKSSLDIPQYRRLLVQLTKIRRSNNDLRFVYIVDMNPADRSIDFLLDTEPPTSDIYIAPGDPYDDAPDELKAVFSSGKTVLVGPYTDRWGEWISGFAPLKDDTGAILGVVGMDISASSLEASVSASRLMGILITFLLGIIGAGIGLLIERNSELTRANARLTEEVSWRKRTESALNSARIRADEANQAKGRFLATMSHEIRSPMSSIIGLSDLALRHEDSPEQRERLDTVRESAEHLLSVIDDILEFSMLEAGKLQLDNVDFRPDLMLDSIKGLMAVQAEKKNLLLDFSLGEDVPDTLRGDPKRLRQVIVNLVGNALKYTDNGEVRLAVTGATPDDYKKHGLEFIPSGAVPLLFSVTDTGVGIPENKLETIFKSYSRASDPAQRKHDGFGLGLATCKQLVGMMGGDILVQSKMGKGSTFSFVLPLKPGGDIGEQQANAAPALEGRPLKILLADDDETNSELARLHLSTRSHTVHVVEDGERAVNVLSAAPYDLVLMDMEMPHLDGLEATRMVRNGGGANAATPILLMTAHALDAIRDKGLEAGVNGFVIKPLDREKLLSAIDRVLGG